MRSMIRHFFTDNDTPSAHTIKDLQRRATWIALALILQALNEIDHNYYKPILRQFTSLPPLFLLLGSFYALWMAIRPVVRPPAEETHTSHVSQRPKLWQRIVLFL